MGGDRTSAIRKTRWASSAWVRWAWRTGGPLRERVLRQWDRGEKGHQSALLNRSLDRVECADQAERGQFFRKRQVSPRDSPARAGGKHFAPPAAPPLYDASIHAECGRQRLHPGWCCAFPQRRHQDDEHPQVDPPVQVPCGGRGHPLPASIGRAAQAQSPTKHVTSRSVRSPAGFAPVVRLIEASPAAWASFRLRRVPKGLVNLKENRPEAGLWRDRVRQH